MVQCYMEHISVRKLAEMEGVTRSAFLKWVKKWAAETGHEIGWSVELTPSGQRQRCRAVTTKVAEAIRAARQPHYIGSD